MATMTKEAKLDQSGHASTRQLSSRQLSGNQLSSRRGCSERGLIASKDRSALFAKSANPFLAIFGGGQLDNRLPL
jgi:hypothetical protein